MRSPIALAVWVLLVVVGVPAIIRADEQPTSPVQRTAEEVAAYIEAQGRQKPDWWDSAEPKYPSTLDLTWPLSPPTGEWNAQKNVGQYIWDVVNPNPGRWREGIRLVHQLLLDQQSDVAKRTRDMRELGNMYYRFEQDYARAAFWWRHSGIEGGVESPLVPKLAECYYRLGCKDLAYETLQKGPYFYNTIKVLADMGETDAAIQLADRFSTSARSDLAYLYAGDACRVAARYDDAIRYYQRVADAKAPDPRFQKMFDNSKRRAEANIAAINVFDRLDPTKIPDGSYTGKAAGYAGDVIVKVTVQGGRITDVTVTSYKEKQFFTALTDTPRQIVARQGIQGVDAVTGATITSEAIVNGVAQALSSAQPK